MKRILSLSICAVLLFSSCQSKPQINEDAGMNSNFVTQSKGVFDNDGYIATASEDGIYMLDQGKLKYVDIESLNEVTLTSLNFADDKEIDATCPENFKSYCEIAVDNFLQYYDSYIFFLARRLTVEGEEEYQLNRLNPNGSKQETILKIKSNPSQLTIMKGHLFYVDVFSKDVLVSNLNTSDTQKIAMPMNQDFISFQYSDDFLYVQTFDINEQTHHFYRYDFLNHELQPIVSRDIQIIDGDGSNLLIYDIVSWNPLLADRKVVNQNMELIAELDGDDRHLNYLDSNYIYTSSLQSPQRYVIYDYQGNVVYDIDALDSLKESEFIHGVSSSMEASQIQGIIGDNIFVVGGADNGLKYYLVDLKTEEWHEVFKSVSEVMSNG